VSTASGGLFDTIRPICIDGRPQYEFINRTTYDAVLPQNVLYKPIDLSQERYDQLNLAPGHLIVQVQCKDYTNTEGANAYEMDDVEHRAGYKVKVPINDNGFEYPIQYISIDVVKVHGYDLPSYFAQDLIVSKSTMHGEYRKALQNYEGSLKIFDQLKGSSKRYVKVIRSKIDEIHKNIGK
jgi:hypothetical protein